MESLLEKFENLKTLLTEKASGALGEALLSAFLSSLSDYETAVVSNVNKTGKELGLLRNENDLLRSLLGKNDSEILARSISLNEEMQLAREKKISLVKELEETHKIIDQLHLENNAMETDLETVRRLRKEEQEKFSSELDSVKEQLKVFSQKTLEKQQELDKERSDLRQQTIDKEREIFIASEDEIRSVAVKLHALVSAAENAVEDFRSSLEQTQPSLMQDLQQVLERNQQVGHSIDQYLRILNWDKPEFIRLSWIRLFMQLKKHFSESARTPGVKLSWPHEKTLTPFISDEKMLFAIIEVLVQNAFEAFSGAGSIEIVVELTLGSLQLFVIDSGAGIKAQDKDKIFYPFYTTKPGHEGMGLPKARKLARVLGGTLLFEAKDFGTCFSLTLPAQNPSVIKTPIQTI